MLKVSLREAQNYETFYHLPTDVGDPRATQRYLYPQFEKLCFYDVLVYWTEYFWKYRVTELVCTDL